MVKLARKDSVYILNHCTRSLGRDNRDDRHNYGQYDSGDPAAAVAEAWRFPIVDSYRDPATPDDHQFNTVTFVCANRGQALGPDIAVIGSFADLVTPVPLRQIEGSIYWAESFVVPKGQSHYYKFVAGDRAFPDPINPQRVTRPDGSVWSGFFTDYCSDTLVLQEWEAKLLERLTDHILPFRTTESQRFLNYYYEHLDPQARENQFAHAHRLDQSVGVVNFIDKILAKQERHRLIDYRLCLRECDRVLRTWVPDKEPTALSSEKYAALYEQMSSGTTIAGWDYARYSNPRFFLQLLRRHTFTGAFAHPKHGGNAGAAGWQFLAANLVDPTTGALPVLASTAGTTTYFDWARAQEQPLGRSTEYFG